MIYNLTDKTALDDIVQLVESQSNQDRIDRHIRAYQIVNGNQKQYVEQSVQAKYQESHDAMTKISVKIGEKIIRKLSRAYSAGVKREVVDSKTGVRNQKLTELLERIYADINEEGENFDDVMVSANKLYSNHNYVEIFSYLDKENKIRFKPLPQHLFTSLPNSRKTRAEAIIFKHDHTSITEHHKFVDWDNTPEELKGGEVVGIYTLWSENKHFTFSRIKAPEMNAEGKHTGEFIFGNVLVMREGNKGNDNPFGVIPFVPIKQKTEGHYYPYGNEIAEMSVNLCVIFTDIVHIAAEQGFGQAVIYYDGDTPPSITKSGPTHVVALKNTNGNSKFEFANANPDLNGHLDIALALTRILLTTNDLTTDKVSGELNATNFASAIDRLIADSESIQNMEDQQKKYARAEQDQFKVVINMLKYLKETNLWPEEYASVNLGELDDKKYKLKINFNAIKPMTTEKDKAETIVYLDENGFILPHYKHMRFNEGMTEKEALEFEKKIKEHKEQKAKDAMLNNSSIFGEQKDGDTKEQDAKPDNPFKKPQEEAGRSGTPERQREEADREPDNKADKKKDPERNRR